MDGVLALIHVAGAFRHVLYRVGVSAEAAHIQLPHVVTRLSLHDPLRGIFPRATTEDDSEDAEAGQNVKSRKAGYRPHQAFAIRRIAIGSVDDALDPHVREGGHATGGSLEHLHEPVEIGWEQTALEVLGHSLECPRLRPSLERADEQPTSLLSNVERGSRVTKHRQFDLEGAEFFDRLSDEKLVLEEHDRDIDPDHTPDLFRPLTGSVDHDFSADLPFRGPDEPTPAGSLDRGHGRVTEDLRPLGASSLRERLRHIARLDVSVCGQVGCSDDTVQIEERE